MDEIQNPRLENIERLEKLYKYLNYEISSSILFVAGWFFALFIPILFLAAIIFTPFMLYVLYKESKNGWVISFVLLIIIPAILTAIFYPVLSMFGLIPFYFYCFLLRMEARNWLEEKRAKNEMILEKIKRENEKADLDDLGFFIQK
ncbi:MAG: hypothetical protein GXO85_17195 [Chlorobi bacterium]|nr:hypothetical protein [Chlorobiota bacterium]